MLVSSEQLIAPHILSAAAEGMRGFAVQHPASFGVEQSVKFEGGQVFDQRFLLTFALEDFDGDCYLRLKPLLLLLDFPQDLHLPLRRELQRATILHIGFEAGANGEELYKIYCEYADNVQQHLAARKHSAIAVHCAFKWLAGSPNSYQISDYFLQPCLSLPQLCDAVRQHGNDMEWLFSLFELAATKVAAEQLFYLDVKDRNSPRHSFALTLYDAKLAVAELESPTVSPAHSWGISSQQWQQFIQQYGTMQLGNIAVGRSKDNRSFGTVYFKAFEQNG